MRGLIISGGTIDDKFACEEIKHGGYEMIVAADSGMDFLYRHHITPDIIVGDFDSVEPESYSYFKELDRIEFCTLNPEKDDTDTEFAVRDAISRGVTELTILGGTGGRVDHLIGNINLLGIGLEEKVHMQMLDTRCRIRMIDGTLTLKKQQQFGSYVSLLPYRGAVKGMTLNGFKYNLTGYTMDGFNTLGISNQIVEEEAKIEFKEGILLVIESRD